MEHLSETEDQKSRIAGEILRLRMSQMIVNEENKAGKFKIPIHLAMGHEALAVAVAAAMKEADKLVLPHRNIAYNLARGDSLKAILDEFALKRSGLAEGTLGSMNLMNPEAGIIYTSSILANNFSVSAGVAMGLKLAGGGGVSMVFGGDGSIEEGAFYESMLLLRSFGLGSLIFIENNEWSLATHVKERRTPIDLVQLTRSLGVEYLFLEGNDPFEYAAEIGKAREFVLCENLPVCVEVKVWTLGDWRGEKTATHPEGRFINYHSGPAPTVELKEWPLIAESNADPLFVLREYFDDKQLLAMSKEILGRLQKELA